MSLQFKEVAIGQSIHHYRVEAELGQGGMGKVFRAWDDHLDRCVAIKVLAVQAFMDNDRKDRFLREARIASALNHPNILHMYDVDQTPEGIDYIVMEYVQGKTLGSLINGRGLPLTTCVKYARQIAGALALAHDKGIIHRDIKPANIMIAEDGTVKVLDYGLSILTEPAQALDPDKTTLLPSSGSGGSRRNAASTMEGAVVGTIPYMSPEQTRGEPCDARSDIFSFGSLLYEMVTGRRAFGGDAAATVISAILRDQPEPARASGEEIPHEMDQVISRCLQKDPARRFHCMHDVQVALEEVLEIAPAEEISSGGRKTPRWAMAATVAAILILGAGVVLGRILKPPPSASTPQPQVVLLSRDADYPRFSPDGQWVVYAAYRDRNMELFKRKVEGGDEVRLTTTAGNETEPAWSREGWIAFVSDQDGGGIFELSADQPGGPVRRLTSAGKNPRWAPDGTTLAYEQDSAVYVLARGEAPRQIVPGTGGSPQMVWSPDGKQLILWNYSQNDVCMVPVAGGACRLLGLVPLGEEVSGLSWSKDGRWLIMSRGPFGGAKALWAIPFNSSAGKPAGSAIRLTVSSTDDVHCALSPDGRTLVYTARDVDQDLYSFPINPETGQASGEQKLIPISVSHRNYYPAVSRSGDFLVWTAQTGSQGLLYVKHLGRHDEQRLTGEALSSMREVTAALSPNASEVVYSSTIGGSYALWLMPAINRIPVKLIATAGRQLDSQPAWSPDGRTIAFYSNRSGNLDIWSMDVSGKDLRRIIDWKSNEYWPVWSPDGRRLAFVSDHSGNPDIWVRDNTTGKVAPYIQQPAEEGFGTWSPNGRFFYFSSDRSGEFQIWVRSEQTGEIRQVTDFKGPEFGLPQSALYTKFAVADSQLIVPLQTRKTDVAVLQNWQGVR